MSHAEHDATDDATMQAVMKALRDCYGSLDDPNFRKVSDKLRSNPYSQLTEAIRANGIEITDTTDLNGDVSVQLVLDRSGDQVGLGLSGVGPYAVLLHEDADERYSWITQSENAPTPLAALIAAIVKQAGFKLLDRDVVTRTITMSRPDGTTEATLYQALFTDTDRIP